MFSYFGYVWLTEWPPIGKITAYYMFSQYKYQIVNLVFFPTSVFWNVNFFLTVPFPGHCLLLLVCLFCGVPSKSTNVIHQEGAVASLELIGTM